MMQKTAVVEFSVEDALRLLSTQKELEITSPYNVLTDGSSIFSSQNYDESCRLLYGLNTIRGFQNPATEVAMNVEFIHLPREKRQDVTPDFSKYFGHLPGGYHISVGYGRTEVELLEGVLKIECMSDGRMHISDKERKPLKLEPRNVAEIIGSIERYANEVLEPEDPERPGPTTGCRISLHYFCDGIDMGKILLGEKGGQTTLVPITLKE